MKKTIPYSLVYLATHLLSFAATPATTPLLALDFNAPTELTYNFPPLPGEKWNGPFESSVAVNSNDGQAKVVFGEGYGVGNTGALYVEVVKSASNFMQLNFDRITIFSGDASSFTVGNLRDIELEFSAKIPSGFKVEAYAMLIVPKEWKNRAWASRLTIGEVVGTGVFKSYKLSGLSAQAAATESFAKLAQEHGLNNGAQELKISLAFKLVAPSSWPVGSGFQIDDLVLSRAAGK